ncbi:hypothetical protein EVAR_26723_1 [Eumeta japonica]|uniref:Uncharacterized protein n=1 Tax=Eumeta variegata TaxID=151549 RepID=A0A4C1X927_EUMVA|nr:hypothetical protein EVAR_26723_1 [Eumeta japonica]
MGPFAFDPASALDLDAGSALDSDAGSALDSDAGSALDSDAGSAIDSELNSIVNPDFDLVIDVDHFDNTQRCCAARDRDWDKSDPVADSVKLTYRYDSSAQNPS